MHHVKRTWVCRHSRSPHLKRCVDFNNPTNMLADHTPQPMPTKRKSAFITPRMTSKSPAAATMTTPSDLPTAIPGETTGPKEGCISRRAAKKPPKVKRFSPSRAKTLRYASHHFSSTVLIILRGKAERKWSQENPSGTKAQFVDYFKKLSEEQLQVSTQGRSQQ